MTAANERSSTRPQGSAITHRFFVVRSVEVAASASRHPDDGEIAAFLKLDVHGEWSHGQRQTLHLIATADLGVDLAALLTDGAVTATEGAARLAAEHPPHSPPASP